MPGTPYTPPWEHTLGLWNVYLSGLKCSRQLKDACGTEYNPPDKTELVTHAVEPLCSGHKLLCLSSKTALGFLSAEIN